MEQFFELRVGDLRFSAVERPLSEYDTVREFVVAPEVRGGPCVVFHFGDPSLGSAVLIQSILYNSACSSDLPLVRRTGTRAMVLGAMHAFMRRARTLYPHLRSFELADEAHFPCPPISPSIKTFATDLLLSKTTYYQRHLGVRPTTARTRALLDSVAVRLDAPVAAGGFDAFWTVLTTADTAVPRTRRQMEWLGQRRDEIQRSYVRAASRGRTWRQLFRCLHAKYDCAFFACCWWRLCVRFGMTGLVGASWTVDFGDVPRPAEVASLVARRSGGGVAFRRAYDAAMRKAHALRHGLGRFRGPR